MNLRLERRAEIALRSLQTREKARIAAALARLQVLSRADVTQDPHLGHLVPYTTDRKLYVYKATPNLRLILTFDNDICVVEDIVDHDRLDRLIRRKGQQ